ncbi:MAG: hypothetical protein HY901_10085 [Deltaproteobacteria bacterium]|nr:hypothetical protein [Deltaproteobacteria bacterium]
MTALQENEKASAGAWACGPELPGKADGALEQPTPKQAEVPWSEPEEKVPARAAAVERTQLPEGSEQTVLDLGLLSSSIQAAAPQPTKVCEPAAPQEPTPSEQRKRADAAAVGSTIIVAPNLLAAEAGEASASSQKKATARAAGSDMALEKAIKESAITRTLTGLGVVAILGSALSALALWPSQVVKTDLGKEQIESQEIATALPPPPTVHAQVPELAPLPAPAPAPTPRKAGPVKKRAEPALATASASAGRIAPAGKASTGPAPVPAASAKASSTPPLAEVAQVAPEAPSLVVEVPKATYRQPLQGKAGRLEVAVGNGLQCVVGYQSVDKVLRGVLSCEPWALVTVDGQTLGRTPVPMPDLGTREVQVELSRPDRPTATLLLSASGLKQ